MIVVDTDKLRGIISEKGTSQFQVAKHLGVTPKTFYCKMKKGVFDSDEITEMIAYLDIRDPIDIFFKQSVT